jgi:hypothetical protein
VNALPSPNVGPGVGGTRPAPIRDGWLTPHVLLAVDDISKAQPFKGPKGLTSRSVLGNAAAPHAGSAGQSIKASPR